MSAAHLNQDSRTSLIAAHHPRFDGSRVSDIKPGTVTGLLTFNRTGSSASTVQVCGAASERWVDLSNSGARYQLDHSRGKEATMRLNPYLLFSGQCEAAFKFYEQCLGGKIEVMMTHAGTPAEKQVPAEWRNKILHARLAVRDQVLMGSDAPPGRQEAPKGFSVSLTVDSSASAERIFHALAENGTVRMPIQKTFWAERFGMLVDRFGIPWMINFEEPDH
jgi:PhnB protein